MQSLKSYAATAKEVRERAGAQITRLFNLQPNSEVMFRSLVNVANDSHVGGILTARKLLDPLLEEVREQLAQGGPMHHYFVGRESALLQMIEILDREANSR